jgi:hypothetical protein
MKQILVNQQDVFGTWNDITLVNRGMVVAQGCAESTKNNKEDYQNWKKIVKVTEVCPVWGDILPYKSVTVICKPEECNSVEEHLFNVHGGSYSIRKVLEDGRIAYRSDYQAW